MKIWLVSPVILALAACSGAEDSVRPTDVEEVAATGSYTAENPATTESCFHESDRAAQLLDGQALLERGPAAIVHISYNFEGRQANYVLPIMQMDQALRDRTEAASAAFFRATGAVFDITTDAVIYDRERDGSFCTVTNVEEIIRPFVSEADAIAELFVPAETPAADE